MRSLRWVLIFVIFITLSGCSGTQSQVEPQPHTDDTDEIEISEVEEQPIAVNESDMPEDLDLSEEVIPEPESSGRIVFHTVSDDQYQTCDIGVIDVDTGAIEFLTSAETKEQYRYPRWSPDKSEIAMLHGICCQGSTVSFLDMDDFSYTDMFNLIDYIWPASYAPGGNRLVFSARSGGEINLFILDRLSGEWTQITFDKPGDIAPDWHPSRDQIVFAKNTSGFTNIAVINADGTNYQLLTDEYATSTNPRWSPDGSKIIFESDLNGNDEIYMINADGSGLQNITDHPMDDKDPAWSPDGRMVAFISFREPFGMYILDLENGETRFLMEGGRAPDWGN